MPEQIKDYPCINFTNDRAKNNAEILHGGQACGVRCQEEGCTYWAQVRDGKLIEGSPLDCVKNNLK
jgi:hypothetical protein